jgi:regulatory protein CII
MKRKPEAPARLVPSPFEAFRDLCYVYGVAKMAGELGMKPGTLYNKADADDDSHNQPTLRDVVLATRLSGDLRVLDALEEMFGRAAFDVSQMALKSDEALLELVTCLGKESGEFHAAVHRALLQRKFIPADLARIREEAFDMVSALMTLVARLEGLVDD